MNRLRKTIFPIIICVLLYIPVKAQHDISFDNPPGLISYSFISKEYKILPGKSTEKARASSCTGKFFDTDTIGNLAVVSLFYQNGCYTDSKYSNTNYKVEHGIITDEKSKVEFDAYKIYEPALKASKFLASKHAIYYKFPGKEDYTVYSHNGEKLSKVAEISSSKINQDSFTKIEGAIISGIKGEITYLFAPSGKKISGFTSLGKGIEGARIKSTSDFNVYKYRFNVNASPFDNKTDFNYGPESWHSVYSKTRQYFIVTNNNTIGAVWQDQKRKYIYLTWISEKEKSYKNIRLKNSSRDKLAAATFDDSGNIYYLTVEDLKSNRYSAIRVTLYKVDSAGKEQKKRDLKTAKSGMNMVFFDNYVASMSFSKNKLGLIIARGMHRSSDGLSHQGAIALIIDSNSLRVEKNWGQTSGHSFDSILYKNSSNEFVGIDLGDNYPRGIHLHKFTESFRHSRVVYTFKTLHGTNPASPAGRSYPFYPEISKGGKSYYKWSNDNRTYTELGGLIEGKNSYTIIFAGEPDSSGRAINNARVGTQLNDARNIGLVQVISTFEKTTGKGCEVSDDLVLSDGISESGGFYTFGGRWSKQRNSGVKWLTKYANKDISNASRIKAVKVSDNKILLLWEKWTPGSYITTYAMLIGDSGNPGSSQIDLGSHVRLHRRDDPICVGSKVYLFTGDKIEKKLEMIVFKIK